MLYRGVNTCSQKADVIRTDTYYRGKHSFQNQIPKINPIEDQNSSILIFYRIYFRGWCSRPTSTDTTRPTPSRPSAKTVERKFSLIEGMSYSPPHKT